MLYFSTFIIFLLTRQAIEAALKFDPSTSTAPGKIEPLITSSTATGGATGTSSEPNSSRSAPASAHASASASSDGTLAGKAPPGGGADGGAQRANGTRGSAAETESGLLWWGVVGAGACAVLGLAIGMAKWRR